MPFNLDRISNMDKVPNSIPVVPNIAPPQGAKSAHEGKSPSSKKRLIGGVIAVLFLATTIGIGSYFLKNRQTTLTQAGPTDLAQCEGLGGIVRSGSCQDKEMPIGLIGGGDSQQICCKAPESQKSCPLQCIPASESASCDSATLIREGCGLDEVCCSPKTGGEDPIPSETPTPTTISPSVPVNSPPPTLNSPAPSVPLPDPMCPDPNQKINVRVECVSCAD